MVTFSILLFIALCLLLIAGSGGLMLILALLSGAIVLILFGGPFLVMVGDVIICALLIAGIVKLVKKIF